MPKWKENYILTLEVSELEIALKSLPWVKNTINVSIVMS